MNLIERLKMAWFSFKFPSHKQIKINGRFYSQTNEAITVEVSSSEGIRSGDLLVISGIKVRCESILLRLTKDN